MRLVASMVSANFSKIPGRDRSASSGRLSPAPGDLVQRKIDAQLESLRREKKIARCARKRISESLSLAAVLVQILADAPVNLPAARGVLPRPMR